MEAKDSASSGVVTTTANGCPFPIGLPSVTMSGTTPRKMHNYIWLLQQLDFWSEYKDGESSHSKVGRGSGFFNTACNSGKIDF